MKIVAFLGDLTALMCVFGFSLWLLVFGHAILL